MTPLRFFRQCYDSDNKCKTIKKKYYGKGNKI